MAHAEKTIFINRPVGSVFDFILNGANNRLWRSSVVDIKPLGEAPYGVGARFEQGLKGPTGRIAGDYEITEVKPNQRHPLPGDGGAGKADGPVPVRIEGSVDDGDVHAGSSGQGPGEADGADGPEVDGWGSGDAVGAEGVHGKACVEAGSF